MDKSTLESLSKPVDEFCDDFLEKIVNLSKHAFIAAQQTTFFHEQVKGLQPGTIIVGGDFAENYAFVVQDAIQGIC